MFVFVFLIINCNLSLSIICIDKRYVSDKYSVWWANCFFLVLVWMLQISFSYCCSSYYCNYYY